MMHGISNKGTQHFEIIITKEKKRYFAMVIAHGNKGFYTCVLYA